MGLRDSQLVEHTLHLLVDAEGCALLLIPIGLAGPVTLRQGGVLLDGSLALPLPPPHGWDLNGRQVQRLQRRGRVREEKGRRAVGRAGGEAGTSRRGGRAEREDTVTMMTGTEHRSYRGTGSRSDTDGGGCRLRGKNRKKHRRHSCEVRGAVACCDHMKMCTTANEDFFFSKEGLSNEMTEQKRKLQVARRARCSQRRA